MNKRPINHGTIGGFETHRRRGEVPCQSCKEARSTYLRGRADKDRPAKRRYYLAHRQEFIERSLKRYRSDREGWIVDVLRRRASLSIEELRAAENLTPARLNGRTERNQRRRVARAFQPSRREQSLDGKGFFVEDRFGQYDRVLTDSAWADPTGDTATRNVEMRIDDLPTFLSAAKQCPIVPRDLVVRAVAGEFRIVVYDNGPRVMATKGAVDILPWVGGSEVPSTMVISNARSMRHHGSRGHKGHARSSWKGHVSKSAKGRKTKVRA